MTLLAGYLVSLAVLGVLAVVWCLLVLWRMRVELGRRERS